MTEKEYQEYLKVRSQLSYLDRLRTAEYELQQALKEIDAVKKRLDAIPIIAVDTHIEELEKRRVPESTAGFLELPVK